MAAGRPVVCTFCNVTVYDYTGPAERVVFKADYFAPRKDFPKPDQNTPLACPNCGEKWTAVSNQIDGIRMAVSPATRGSGVVKY